MVPRHWKWNGKGVGDRDLLLMVWNFGNKLKIWSVSCVFFGSNQMPATTPATITTIDIHITHIDTVMEIILPTPKFFVMLGQFIRICLCNFGTYHRNWRQLLNTITNLLNTENRQQNWYEVTVLLEEIVHVYDSIRKLPPVSKAGDLTDQACFCMTTM